MALAACGAVERSATGGDAGGSSAGGSQGANSGGSTTNSGGSAGAGGSYAEGGAQLMLPSGGSGGGPAARACSADGSVGGNATGALFCDQVVRSDAPATRVLYSWTTAEQAAELRRDRLLFTRTERPGMGPGYAFTYMANEAAHALGAAATLLNGVIGRFEKARYAWPHPWATRMGWPGEDYGDQLLRIVLKPEAWVMVVSERAGLSVVDLYNRAVSLEDAAAASERIGAVYFVKTDVSGNGSFAQCSGGYREFIVGNLAMIEQWSLGTELIRARVEADAELIESFRRELEPTPVTFDATRFNALVACAWDERAYTDLERYERALAIPSANYLPTQSALTTLRDTLLDSLFEPDPLVVTPSE